MLFEGKCLDKCKSNKMNVSIAETVQIIFWAALMVIAIIALDWQCWNNIKITKIAFRGVHNAAKKFTKGIFKIWCFSVKTAVTYLKQKNITFNNALIYIVTVV